jgi:hypothetical protein
MELHLIFQDYPCFMLEGVVLLEPPLVAERLVLLVVLVEVVMVATLIKQVQTEQFPLEAAAVAVAMMAIDMLEEQAVPVS